MSAIAIIGFGPGTIIEEPIGVLCSGCRQPVGIGQRGYLLRSQGLTEEAWHRGCTRDPETALTGHSTLGAARSVAGR